MKSTAGILNRQKKERVPQQPKEKKSVLPESLENALRKFAQKYAPQQSVGLKALYEKEMMDHIRSRKFQMILVLVVITSYASLYGAISGLSDSTSEYLFLSLYTTSGNSIPSFLSFIALLGPFVGIILGFDGISGEKSDRTLYRIAAQPIYRDSIINGKFLAGASLITVMVFVMGISIGAIGLIVIGFPPSVEEVARIFVFLLFTVVYICFWLGLSLLFSVVCNNAATSAMASIGLWIFFALFMSLVASMIAGIIYPVNTQMQQLYNSYANYTLDLNLNRISPYYLYSEAVTTIMNPSVRSVNVVTMQSLDGTISGYLGFWQSVLLVWPHLAGLIALMLATFTGSYVCFMRQEIRAK
ncbi:MAG: ABC transporter permease [Lachnospiraceae bacterium]|nr:ABC transporter permease [Lachnospiraceae bacterium]